MIHPVFYVTLLKPFRNNAFPGLILTLPDPVQMQVDEELIVNNNFGFCLHHGKL